MWPINYDDPNKLHMSIGIGLLVAAFLLGLVSIAEGNDVVDELNEKLIGFYKEEFHLKSELEEINRTKDHIPVEETESKFNILGYKLEFLEHSMNITNEAARFAADDIKGDLIMVVSLSILGLFFFAVGYLPYIKKHGFF